MTELVLEGYRLSLQQKRFWLLQREAPVYLSQGAVRLDAAVRPEDLRLALDAVVARHEILRTTFSCLPGMEIPVQVVGEGGEEVFEVVAAVAESLGATCERLLREAAGQPFDPARGARVRLALIQLPEEEPGALVLTVPGLYADDRSLQNLLRELVSRAAGGPADDEPPVQYVDFSEWQNGILDEAGQGEVPDGEELLASLPVLPFLPRWERQTPFAPRSRALPLDPVLAAAAEGLAVRHGVPLPAVFLAVWQALLLRFSDQERLFLGVLDSGRAFEQLAGALGRFARYLPVPCVAGDLRFSELLDSGESLREAVERYDRFGWNGALEGSGFFPAVFDHSDWREAEAAGRFSLLGCDVRIDRYGVRLSALSTRSGPRLELGWDASRLDAAAADLLAGRIRAVLRSALADPERPLWALDLLGDEERRQILAGWNDTERSYPATPLLPHRLALRAATQPEAPAVVAEGETITFHELRSRANRFAHLLIRRGVAPDRIVGLLAERGVGQVVGLWGILAAGGAYLPLDPLQPAGRLADLVADAGVSLVVGEERFRALLPGVSWVPLELSGKSVEAAPDTDPDVAITPDHLAYVIFTSGSTGRPKGVMIRQGSVANLAHALEETVYGGLGSRLRVALNAPLTFDASVKQWIQLAAGHCLVVIPEEVRSDGGEILAFLRRQRVDVLDCTPSQLQLLLDAGLEREERATRLLLIGGEAISPDLWKRLGRWPAARCFNVYGPTECTVDTAVHRVDGEGAPVLGGPLGNVQVYVADRRGQPAPVGLAGELWIGGRGVARGYLGRPELTAERFVPDPFGEASGGRLYRSGDLVRWDGAGRLEFLGRIDHQVKLRGYRIELGEIEETLRRHPGVAEAVVVLRQDAGPERSRLVAYAVPRRTWGRTIDGRVRWALPNGLAVVEQNRNETTYLFDEIFAKQSYLRHGVSLPPGARVLDVGANIGMFSMFVRQICPTARIWAFEPIPPIFATLSLNAELYVPGALLFPFGLSDRERTESFLYYPRYSMMSGQSLYSRPAEEVEVVKRYLRNEGAGAEALLDSAEELLAGRFEGEICPGRLRRLSDVLHELAIERVDLLKIDVQRAELDVLRGLDEPDWERVGQVVMEVHDARGSGTEGRARLIVGLLESRGFRVVVEQDELLAGTDRYNLYAVRPGWQLPDVLPVDPPAESPGILRVADLREHLRRSLPDYMLPAAVVLLDALPLTRNGKVDRAALPAPDETREEGRQVDPPRTPFEELMISLWHEVLGAAEMGIHDSFFELGGHSLLATQLVSRVREHFQVELPLRALFDGPTVAQLAARVEQAMRVGGEGGAPPLEPRPRGADLPLSFAQERLWFLHQMAPGSPVYNSVHLLQVEGPLKLPVVWDVFGELMRRHEALRTTYPACSGAPVQRIVPAVPLFPILVDLSGLAEPERSGELRRVATVEACRPFDLENGPVLRLSVLRIRATEHALLLAFHHIVGDGWSLSVIAHDFAALYSAFRQGRPSPLRDLPVQAADFAVWQRAWLSGEVLDGLLAYWRGRLGDAAEALDLPLDRPRPAVPSFQGAVERFPLPGDLRDALHLLGRREGATLFMTLLAAFQALLHRTTGQEAVRVGAPIAGRNRLEIEKVVGFFVNTLVLRTDLAGGPGFREALERVRGEALGAYAHQDLPFEKLVAELSPERDLAVSPLFQALFSLQNVPFEPLEMAGLRLASLPVHGAAAPFDLTLVLWEVDEGIVGELQYARELFEAATARRLLRHLRTLIEAALAEPDRPLAELSLLTAEERRQIVEVWNDTAAPWPEEELLHHLVAAQARRLPHAPAVLSGDRCLTYGELVEQAGRLARILRSQGVGPESQVALCLERSPEMVVAFLAVLATGGAWVPLDPAHPRERLLALLRDAAPAALLASGLWATELEGIAPWTLRLDAAWPAAGAGEAPAPPVWPESPAYVIYTSGSTGHPKGVAVPHRAAVGFVREMVRRFRLAPGDRVLQFASPAFDVVVEEVFPALASGGAVVLEDRDVIAAPAGFGRLLKRQGVTVVELPAAFWHEWLDILARSGERPPTCLRLLILGTEKPSLDRLELWQRFGVPVINIFGLTETTVTSSLYEVPPGPLQGRDRIDLPIGAPIANARLYVLDSRGAPVPVGIPGELFIGGSGLARGYLGRPDATAERFVPDPFAATPGERLYRTGDLARWRDGGILEFLGRIDHQVKVRGIRVELGEIEAHLERHPAVARAVVLQADRDAGERHLVAWVVPASHRRDEASARALRAHLLDLLPAALVPAVFVPIDTVPLTPNGKLDRRALPAPAGWREGGRLWVPPRTPVEEILATIWEDLLQIEKVGADDGFFELGGHSLLATRVVARIRELFRVELPLRALFEGRTLAGLAAMIEALQRTARGSVPPPVRRGPHGDLPLSFAQQRLWLIDQLEPGSSAYNVRVALLIDGPLAADVLACALAELVRRHEALRTVFVQLDGRPVQRILPAVGSGLPLIDLSGLPAGRRDEIARALAAEEGERPFDLARGPLLRAVLIRLASGAHLFLLTQHHIVCDEWSAAVLVREVAALYTAFSAGGPSPLPELPVQAADFALWQRAWLQGDVLRAELEYWRERLAGAPEALDLPVDRARPSRKSFHGGALPLRLEGQLSERLRRLGRDEGATPFMTLLALYAALLGVWAEAEDLCIGTPVAGRRQLETEEMIGFFVNTLVLRIDLAGAPSFRELLRRVRETALDAFAHQDLPFEVLLEEIRPERHLSRDPLFQVFFSLAAPAAAPAAEVPELRLRELPPLEVPARFDLELAVAEDAAGFGGSLVYSADLFDAPTAVRFADRFERLAGTLITDPETRPCQVDLLSAAERHQVLREWSGSEEVAWIEAVHEAISRRAAERPEAVALEWEGGTWSYGALERWADCLACRLAALGVGREMPVGVLLERSPELVAALLAIWKAGGAFVALDPELPAGRLAFMVEDGGVAAIVTRERWRGSAPLPEDRIVLLESGDEILPAEDGPGAVRLRAAPQDLAYLLYTSGTTGRPKAVLVEHGSLAAILEAGRRRFGWTAGDRMPCLAPASFDIFFFELLSVLMAGGTSILVPIRPVPDVERLAGQLAGCTALHAVPALMRPIVEAVERRSGTLESLRAAFVGGDKVPADLLEAMLQVFPRARIQVLYGPTEGTILCTGHEVARSGEARPLLGRPLPGVRIFVASATGQPVPIGAPGEILLGGSGVSRGYHGRPELTAQRYRAEPFGRLYHTGDRGRWLANGRLEFLGRVDDQVKIRGFRVEPGEVEAALTAHPAVRQAVVVAREDGPGGTRLVAYLVAVEGAAPGEAELRGLLEQRLPDYMVPSSFVVLTDLPLTSHGKVDRRRLPAPRVEELLDAPRNAVEEKLARVWEGVLRLGRVGIRQSFFALGGDSILSIQVVARARQAGLHLTPRQVFQYQTIAELAAVAQPMAAAVAEQGVVFGETPLSPIQRRFFELDLPAPHHFNQSLLLVSREPLAPAPLRAAVARVVEHHDGLRLRFMRRDGTWVQEHAAAGEAPFVSLDLSGLPAARRREAIEQTSARLQQSLDLESGPLLRVALFLGTLEEAPRLLWVAHHLVVDGVSWRILLEDLETAYRQAQEGRPIVLPAKTVSFKAWSERLAAMAESPDVQAESGFWLTMVSTPSSVPSDGPGGEEDVRSEAVVSVDLGPDETRLLIETVPAAYRARVDEALLAALVEAIRCWTGVPTLLVELEGHGRDSFDDLDLSRTVGWLTAAYPVALEAADGPGEALKRVKERVRSVPRGGIGFGLLRHLGRDAALSARLAVPVRVSLNYLGRLDRALPGSSPFEVAPEDKGRDRDPRGRREHWLEIGAAVTGGRLQVSWAYSEARFRRETVEALAASFLANLRSLVEHCAAPGAGGYTPSDFPLARLEPWEIDRLLGSQPGVEDVYPLSPLQEGMLFHALLEPETTVYFEQLTLRLRGRLEVEPFRWAWQRAVDRHPVLRTAFAWEGLREPLQIVLASAAPDWELQDWRRLPAAEQQHRFVELAAEDRRRGFSVDRAPLMRFALIRTSEEEHRLVWSHHHLLLDGWSVALLLNEVLSSYAALAAGREPDLPPARPYRGYIGWLRAQDRTAAERYWREILAGFSSPTLLADGRASDPAEGPELQGETRAALPASLTASLGELARRRHWTLNTLIQGAWALLLTRWCASQDVVFGTVIGGRPPELEGAEAILGLFISTLPMRVRTEPGQRLFAWLDGLQAQHLANGQHGSVGLADIQRWSDIPAGSPLFDQLFVFESFPVEASAPTGGLVVEEVQGALEVEYPVTLLVAPGPELRLKVQHDRRRFDRIAAERLLAHLRALLEGLAEGIDRRIEDLSTLAEYERHQLLVEWNATSSEIPRDLRIHDLVAGQARRMPEAVAVSCNGRALTYGELDAGARQLARRLRRAGIGPESRVGVCLERSPEMVLAILAVLAAGGAYVPLDPDYPRESLAFMAADAGLSALLTSQRLAADLSTLCSEVLSVDAETAPEDDREDDPGTGGAGPESLAYVIYTSGSTGRPKGVKISHRNLVHSTLSRFLFYTEEVKAYLLVSSFSFDSSVAGLFWTLCAGGTLVLPGEGEHRDVERLGEIAARHRVSHLLCVPSLYAYLLAQVADESLHGLKTVIVAGEPCPPELESLHFQRLPGVALVNEYGPTEVSVWSLAFRCMPARERGPVPIGRPIANTEAYLLDPAGRPVPLGVVGELHFGGEGVARGYLDRPDLTAERFVPDSLSGRPGGRLYRSGDLARHRPDGILDFQGRTDHQVKVRGFRVEPGEIETTLREQPGVRDAVALVRREPSGGRLVAYVVPVPGGSLSVPSLRDALQRRLPYQMVPSALTLLDDLPRTPAGKVDRHALSLLEPDGEYGASPSPPRSPMEELIAGIWAEVLGAERVGIADDFFALGGHSLLATRIVSRIRAVLGAALPLRALFDAPTVAGLAAAVEEELRDGRRTAPPPLFPVPRHEPSPLAFAQQRLWFLDQLEPGSPAYNVPTAVRLEGVLDSVMLARSFAEVARRHESLRTTFGTRGETPVQVISAAAPVPLPLVDLSDLPAGLRAVESLRLAAEEAWRPFDLARGPLLRTTTLRQDAREHLLLVTQHHIVSDGWSMGILVREVAGLYRAFSLGRPSPFPDLAVQAADFAVWQRSWLVGEVLDLELAYWRAQLAGAPVLDLPTDRPRPLMPTYRGASRPLDLPPALADAVRRLSQQSGCTVFMSLLGALSVLLGRYAGQDDISIGTPIAGRNRLETESLIGCFINTLVLRNRLVQLGFRDFLGQVRETVLDAYAHQDVPFERIVDALAVERDLARNPLFQVMLTLQNASHPDFEVPGLRISALDLPSPTAKFDLEMMITESGRGAILGLLEYSRDLFDAATIDRLAGHFRTLLEAAVAAPATRLGDLPLLTPAERQHLLRDWNDTQAEDPSNTSIDRLIAAVVERIPDAPAVSCAGASLDYQELERRALRLARRLAGLGAGPDTVIGLLAPRGIDFLAAVLGVFKTGAAYLPLDPGYPAGRLRLVLERSGAPLLLIARELAPRVAEALQGMAAPAVLPLEDLFRDAEGEEAGALPLTAPLPDGLAYVISTSGSTGVPKGVMVTRRGLLNHLAMMIEDLGLGADDVVAQNAPLSFDISVWQLLTAALVGGRVHILVEEEARDPRRLLDQVEREGVTVLEAVPSLIRALLDEMEVSGRRELSSLRWMIATGEALPPELCRDWLRLYPRIPLLNAYGPAECSDDVSFHLVAAPPALGEGQVPIGRPLANMRLYVLDRSLHPLPVGVPGELGIAGLGMGRGYLGEPAKTAGAFVPDPFASAPGERLYRTGDLVRLRHGVLEFLGRIDHQVKVRGFRIELGEIEAALAAHPAVRQAVAATSREGRTATGLVAFVVLAADAEPAELRNHLAQRLPEHMVPSRVVRLEALPLTPNGKVDRAALDFLVPHAAESGEMVAAVGPHNPVEEMLAGIWTELLKQEVKDVRTDFFDLGGHSLLATQVMSRVRRAFGTDLPLRSFFEAPTLEGLALAVQEALLASAGEEPPPPLERVARSAPLPLSFAQRRLWFFDQIEPGSSLYNSPYALRFTGPLDLHALARAFSELVRRHEPLRTRFGLLDGEPVQLIDPPRLIDLPRIDLGGLPAEAREAEARRLVHVEIALPFDLAQGPLLRVRLFRMGEQDHVLVLTLHHIVTDGWSVGVMIRDLTVAYAALAEGRRVPLPELSIQYADYASWQRGWLRGPALESLLGYWRRQLAGPLPRLRLPADRERLARLSHRGAEVRTTFGPDLTAALKQLSRRESVTLFITLLAGFQAVLRHHARLDDVIVGTNVAGRNRHETEDLIGFFLNLLVLRTDLSGNPSFGELLARVRSVMLDAHSHQDLPFDLLVDALNPQRDASGQPLFQVKIDLQNAPAAAGELPRLEVEAFPLEQGIVHNDITLYLTDAGERINLLLAYSVDLFERARMLDLVADYQLLLETVVRTPGILLDQLDSSLGRAREERESSRQRDYRDSIQQRLRQRTSRRTEDKEDRP